jgi:hypothetical protein
MKHLIYGSLLILGILYACSDDGNEENDYHDKADRKVCECYEERHDRNDIDYNAELKNDFEFWKARIPQFKKMDRESLLAVIKAFRDEKVKVNQADISAYDSKIRFRNLRSCILKDARLNPDTKKVKEVLDFDIAMAIEGTGLAAAENTWRLSLERVQKMAEELDDLQMLNPFYVRAVVLLYADYSKLLESRKEEVTLKENLEREMKELRDVPPPPPHVIMAPPPVEEIIREEPTEEVPPPSNLEGV